MMTVSDVTTVNGVTVKVEDVGGDFEVLHGKHTRFVAGDLLMVIGGPIHRSATVTTLFRRYESDDIFRYVGKVDMEVVDGHITVSLCGAFEHAGSVEDKGRGSSREFEIASRKLWASAEFRFSK